MAYKMLGQVNPAATTATDLYTCADANGAVVATIFAVNTGATVAKVRIYVRVAGAVLNLKQYIAYDVVLQAAGGNQNSATFTVGLSLANTDVISVYADTANVAVSATGVEAP